MFRVFCIALFTITNSYYNVKSNCVVGFESENVNSRLNNVIKSISEYIGNIQRFIGDKSSYNKEEKKIKNHFLRTIETAFKDIANVGRIGGKYKKRISYTPILDKNNKNDSVYIRYEINAKYMIEKRGYKVETHNIRTDDGYILTAQRIPSFQNHLPKRIIIMHHGILGSSEDWLLLNDEQCLPCLLIEHGCEIWLLNARGNKYSKAHEMLDVTSFEYWDFSWHEMGVFDLPATLSYIRQSTKEDNLHYIGHSMGATALLVLLSSYPEYNSYLKSAILLAPLAFMNHAKGPLKYFGNYLNHRSVISQIADDPRGFKLNDLILHTPLKRKFCLGTNRTCSNPLLIIADGGKDIDKQTINNILNHVPGGGSTKTMLHYMQLIKSGNFQKYDHGIINNLKSYRVKRPPSYNLSAIRLPITLFSSMSDWLANTADVTKLITKIDTVKMHHVIKEQNFGHLDFLWSKSAPQLIYYPIIDALSSIENNKARTHKNRMM